MPLTMGPCKKLRLCIRASRALAGSAPGDESNFIVELTQGLCPPAALARPPAAQESRVAVSRVSSHTSASTKASPPDLIGPQHSDVPARESSLRNRPE